MKLIPNLIPGCFEIEYTTRADDRGRFVKSYQATAFAELGLEASFSESFYSTSSTGVLRGMHFQLPPSDGAKLVCCVQGEVLDVALDLRVGSPAFGKAVTFTLSAERDCATYIPRGVAHGFLTLRGTATLIYHVSSEYDPASDTGILWSSFGVDWPHPNPQLSPRDRQLPPMSKFVSPFRFAPLEVSA